MNPGSPLPSTIACLNAAITVHVSCCGYVHASFGAGCWRLFTYIQRVLLTMSELCTVEDLSLLNPIAFSCSILGLSVDGVCECWSGRRQTTRDLLRVTFFLSPRAPSTVPGAQWVLSRGHCSWSLSGSLGSQQSLGHTTAGSGDVHRAQDY